ncbi:hypothetical protein SAMN05920897_10631 [Alkalispirochaeta americana]|uniref:Uncharacterized protein n=1 Tax=Alkalispirochaeta americana TaxID=159291 RepID=A0A1N6RAT0_9SPIO|nr:hypothetical protein [Alkalispirochaeta americana]SIQ25959.1 hypothetical protein SAMN05920897_10631 [Alkalispirochaeta americana]
MTPRDAFLAELRDRTTFHLEKLAQESAETFGRYLNLPEAAPRIYRRLVEVYQLDGAREVAACMIDLASGVFYQGAIMLTEREYLGLKLIRDEFSSDLPEETARELQDLVDTLGRSDST